MKIGGVFIGLFITVSCFGQIKTPNTPQFPSSQPVYGTAPANGTVINAAPLPNQVQMGATANNIKPQTYDPASVNNVLYQRNDELAQLIRDVQTNKSTWVNINKSRALADTSHFKRFRKSLQELQNMLSGKTPLSVADAYYSIESAFGDPYLSKSEYKQLISRSVRFIKTWMQQNGLDAKDSHAVHMAIQKFMSEILTINSSVSTNDKRSQGDMASHLPFHYDYNDYQGTKDYRNMFLTKCLATGMGQCNSMPAVYLVLAEGMGVPAYLSFAPHHSLIKYPATNGNILNYEPTSGWVISDQWYRDNMFISTQAVTTGIYLDTLNSRQVVANCIFDLAVEYMFVDRTGKDDFVFECLRAGVPYFPRNNNIQSLFIYSMCLKTALRDIMAQYNLSSLSDINRIPKAKELYAEYMSTEAYIVKLGYQDMPAGMYEQLLEEHEFKGKMQQKYNVSGKDKRNLFSNIE